MMFYRFSFEAVDPIESITTRKTMVVLDYPLCFAGLKVYKTNRTRITIGFEPTVAKFIRFNGSYTTFLFSLCL